MSASREQLSHCCFGTGTDVHRVQQAQIGTIDIGILLEVAHRRQLLEDISCRRVHILAAPGKKAECSKEVQEQRGATFHLTTVFFPFMM